MELVLVLDLPERIRGHRAPRCGGRRSLDDGCATTGLPIHVRGLRPECPLRAGRVGTLRAHAPGVPGTSPIAARVPGNHCRGLPQTAKAYGEGPGCASSGCRPYVRTGASLSIPRRGPLEPRLSEGAPRRLGRRRDDRRHARDRGFVTPRGPRLVGYPHPRPTVLSSTP